MKERGLVLAPDLRAKSRSGEKTRTRRIPRIKWNKGASEIDRKDIGTIRLNGRADGEYRCYLKKYEGVCVGVAKPQYQVGDHLYLQEPYQILRTWYKSHLVEGRYVNEDQTQPDDPFGPDETGIKLTDAEWARYSKRKWPHRVTSSRFMYKSLARTWFEVTDVRVALAQDITVDEMLQDLDGLGWDYAESSDGTGDMFMYWDHLNGDMPKWCGENMTSCECLETIFELFWDSLYGEGSFMRDWVFVYTYKLLLDK